MANSVEMPELGESVTEGTITQWLKSVGDTVEVDEPLRDGAFGYGFAQLGHLNGVRHEL